MCVENMLVEEEKSSKEKRSSTQVTQGKRSDEGFSLGLHWDSDQVFKCFKCDKRHSRVCKYNNICFKCGQAEHIQKNC